MIWLCLFVSFIAQGCCCAFVIIIVHWLIQCHCCWYKSTSARNTGISRFCAVIIRQKLSLSIFSLLSHLCACQLVCYYNFKWWIGCNVLLQMDALHNQIVVTDELIFVFLLLPIHYCPVVNRIKMCISDERALVISKKIRHLLRSGFHCALTPGESRKAT